MSGLLAITAALVATCSPALAESEGTMAKQAALLPVRLVSIGAGGFLGIPVAITRRSSNRCIEFTESFADKIGGKDHLVPMTFASLMGVPFGLIVGTGEGVYAGGRNAIASGWEKPFSLESFSLQEDLESH